MRLFICLLFAGMLSAMGADVKFSALPTATSPSTNSFVPIIDLDLAVANQNQKYLITNFATVSYVNSVTNRGPIVGTVSNNVASAGLLAVDASKTNGITATSEMITNTLGYVPVAATTPETVAYSSSITINFTTQPDIWTVLAGDLTLSSSTLAAGKTVLYRIDNGAATNCNVILPATWRKISGTTTNILSSGSIGLLYARSYAANNTNVVCQWSSE